MTRVAVSRQIAELEEALDARLFKRNHRNVALTEAGKSLAAGVNPALDAIVETLQQIRADRGDSRLSITTTAAFATYWLMPRLIDFGARYPDIEVNFVVSDRYLDLEAEGIDVAIRYCPERPKTGNPAPLLREEIFPVYSPKYRCATALTSPQDLQSERLLHLAGVYRAEARWPHWFKTHGLEAPEEKTGAVFNTYINMLQAAIEGQGIALAGFPLVDRFLEDGSLRAMKGIAPLTRDYFYLIARPTAKSDVARFSQWITAQAEAQAHARG